MSAFEFFFSLFGLILGLAIATIAGGMSDMLRERKRIPIGRLTRLTATFLLIDLTSFWVVSWNSLSEIRIVHLIGYAILLFGYVAIIVNDPSLT